MKRLLLLSSVVVAVALLAASLLNAREIITFNTWGMPGGKLLQNSITKAELERMPSWNPNDGPPPISQRDAVRIALKYLAEKHPSFAGAKVAEIKLAQYLIPEYYEDKWFYCVVFMKGIPVTTGVPENVNVVVMLDGTVNEPHPLK